MNVVKGFPIGKPFSLNFYFRLGNLEKDKVTTTLFYTFNPLIQNHLQKN